MQTLTRNTSEMPIVNARIAIVASRVRLVPSRMPTTVFSMIAKSSKYVAKTNAAFTYPLKMSIWSRPVERRYSKTPLFLSYTKSMITGSANRTAERDSKAIESSGKLLVKSMGAGVFMSGGIIAGIIVIRFERTTPYIVRNTPMMM